MNTLMEYLYRDAENCKVWNEAVLKGCLTDEQISQIYQSLDYSLYFVPHLVGLPEERFDKCAPLMQSRRSWNKYFIQSLTNHISLWYTNYNHKHYNY